MVTVLRSQSSRHLLRSSGPRRSTAPARQNHGRGIPPRWTLPLCTAGRHPGLAPQPRRRPSTAPRAIPCWRWIAGL